MSTPTNSTTTTSRRTGAFFLGFLLVALILAGAVSYFADSNPDGLDHATLAGCEVVETAEGERLDGSCVAQRAEDHRLADGPLADYALNGNESTTGLAGVLGVGITVVLAGGLFWLLRKRSRPSTED